MTVQPMPHLDAATEAALRDSISEHGVLVPVLVDQDGDVLDGHNRTRIAGELGMDCPTREVWARDDDHRRELARTTNEDRRQLLDIDKRRAEVARLREQGHSQNAIAGALGVSQSTVRDDLKTQASRATNLPDEPKPGQMTAEEARRLTDEVKELAAELPPAVAAAVFSKVAKWPDRVTGKDGKSYPAAKPKAKPQPKPAELRKLTWTALHRLEAIAGTLHTLDLGAMSPDAAEVSEMRSIVAKALTGLNKLRTQLKELGE